jgi:hypothetical protein
MDTIYTVLARRSAQNNNDKRGFLMQVAVHARACGAGGDDIHGDCRFLPWHRGFIYFHERMIRKTIPGMEDFRLPVWDWDNNPAVPPAYLKWGSTPLAGAAPCRLVSSVPNVTRRDVEGYLQSGAAAFLGGLPGTDKSTPFAAGTVHNAVHTEVGNLFGDMATAAADPLFYAHHANIDRLWQKWAGQTSAHAGPAGWEKYAFTYFDEHGKAVQAQVSELIRDDKWGYRYPPDGWAQPKPSQIEVISAKAVINSVAQFDWTSLLREVRKAVAGITLEAVLSFQLRLVPPDNGHHSVAVEVSGLRIPIGVFGVFAGMGRHPEIATSIPFSLDTLIRLAANAAWSATDWMAQLRGLWDRAINQGQILSIGFLYRTKAIENWRPLPLKSAEIHFRVAA